MMMMTIFQQADHCQVFSGLSDAVKSELMMRSCRCLQHKIGTGTCEAKIAMATIHGPLHGVELEYLREKSPKNRRPHRADDDDDDDDDDDVDENDDDEQFDDNHDDDDD